MLTPLHQLATRTYSPDLNVCHDGQAFVSWPVFIARIRAQTTILKNRAEHRWLLVNENPLEFTVLLFALLHANKQVIIPPNGLPGTLSQLVDAYDAVVTECLSSDTGDSLALAALDIDALSIMLYTSGSTGKPKAVPKRLKQLEAELDVLERLWGAKLGQSAVIATVPHHHIYGLLFRILWPLAARRVFDAVTCGHPDKIAERIAILGNTALISSPSQLTRLPEVTDLNAIKPLPSVIFSSGGALLALASAQISQALGHAPIEVLGSTETGGIAWRCQTDTDTWTALPGVELRVETALQPSQPTLRSPFLFDEQAVLMDDLIEWQPDHTFRLCGRVDKVVKVEQKRLSLTELEQLLGQHVLIAQVAALVVTTRRESVAVVAVLSASGQEELVRGGRNALIKLLKQYLVPYYEAVLLPRYWRFVEAFPVNSVGKVTHAQLMALFDSVAMRPEALPEIKLHADAQIKPVKKSSSRSAEKTEAERKHAAP
jgi:acyl-coenzyme A synthetase/AMP-(fatty) acid ligase